MKILVLGVSGLIGSTVFRVLSEDQQQDVYGTVRSEEKRQFFSKQMAEQIITDVEVTDADLLASVFHHVRPDIVVNCIGATKHKPEGREALSAITLNALLPHRLADLCAVIRSRLIHISTDCVFSGRQGNYREQDLTDARDIYGRSKALGEIDYSNSITLRTSTIGHELQSKLGLLDWFLSQKNSCPGFTKAVFSGLPTVEFARVISKIVIPRSELNGLFHVASSPITKYELLKLIAGVYGRTIEIIPDGHLVIDRSLNANKFEKATGYVSPGWPELIKMMYLYR